MLAKITLKIATTGKDLAVCEIILNMVEPVTRAQAQKRIKAALEKCGEVVSFESSK
jgi:hypothetical protein